MKPRKSKQPADQSRRDFLANAFMGIGLVASHVFAAALGVRFLYPVQRDRRQKLFVGLKSEMRPGVAMPFKTPQGTTVNVIRAEKGFRALSDVCPHLGCRVHWEPLDAQFICPCHDGRFDADGRPVSGPPAEMGAALSSYRVVTEGDVVFIEMRVDG